MRNEIEVVDVVLCTGHVILQANGFPRLIFLRASAIFGITAILKYRCVSSVHLSKCSVFETVQSKW